jgi:hypothetical protein
MNALKKFRDKSKVIFSIETTSNEAILKGTINPDGTANVLKQKEVERKVQIDQAASRATII